MTPTTMRAATFADGQVRVEERPVPATGPGELLVRVHAAGINNADLLQAAGHYPAPPGWPADILGMELAGEIVAMGDGCDRWAEGDAVCAVVGGGAQAEFAIVPEAVAVRLQADIDWGHAGALPEAAATAWDALFTQGQLSAGERVLITGAAGGVGSIAVQLAAHAGGSVVASSRHRATFESELRGLGAMDVVHPHDEAASGPYDVVLELVGATPLDERISQLATGGRIVCIGIGAGRRTGLDLLALLQKRAVVRGSTLRARSRDEHAAIARELEAHVIPRYFTGELQVPIHGSYSLAHIAEAHADFRAGGKFGKFVITP